MAPNYQLSKIYCIRNDKDENKAVFIGATVRSLDECMFQHTRNIKVEKIKHMEIYKLIAEVGVEHFTIELICDFPCNSQTELNEEKGRHIQQLGMIENGCNSRHAGRSHTDCVKAYKEGHKDAIKAYEKTYYEFNKEKIDAQRKASRETNKEKHKAYMKAYNEVNKEKRALYMKAYNAAHRKSSPQLA